MGTVLIFHLSRRPARNMLRPGTRRSEGRGEVVIFPGVRMERHGSDAGLDLAARIGRNKESAPRLGAELDPGFSY
ncbi:hypothetical protein [Stappia sp.]|uniref:hypothetical protein n=1 Tax=Stappia sp. TaxID=1870903 RepID=UPI003A99416E